jgi:hypothetical protein
LTARSVIVGATIFASITSSTAVIGLDPAHTPPGAPTTTSPVTVTTTTEPVAMTTTVPPARFDIPDDPCDTYLADFCVEVEMATPIPTETVAACTTGGSHTPTGTFEVVPAPGLAPDGSRRIRIEVESGLAIDPGCFATEVLDILNDDRGWASVYNIGFAQVDDDSYDLRLVLASPTTTDSLCYPARTAGIYSCRHGSLVAINLMRWESGTDDYGQDLTTYRQYLINHEVGHFLGRGHRRCPAPGAPAPVMMQQTKGLGQCTTNGWPTESER